jgi:hydrogenase maturation factor
MRIGEAMSEISKKNAKELRKAWKEFLKEQEKKKNAKQKEQETVWQSY